MRRIVLFCLWAIKEDANDEMVWLEELNQAREEVEKTSGDVPMEKGMFRG